MKREVNLYSLFIKLGGFVARYGQITGSGKTNLQVMGRKKGAQHLHICFQNFQCTLQIHWLKLPNSIFNRGGTWLSPFPKKCSNHQSRAFMSLHLSGPSLRTPFSVTSRASFFNIMEPIGSREIKQVTHSK